MICRLLFVSGVLGSSIIAATKTPTFADRYDYQTCQPNYASLTVADINGDGIPDLVCGGITTMLGNGDGTFRPGPASNVGVANDPIAIDLNGDGKIDLVAISVSGIIVTFGNGDGTFQPGVVYPIEVAGYPNANFVVTGDFNGDGIPDFATQATDGVWLFTGKGGGELNPGVLVPLNGGGGEVALLITADVNGDGKLDIVASTDSGFTVLLGNGNGTFQPEIDTAVPFPETGFAVGDLNGDGHPDVFSVSNYYANGLLYLGKGDGTFTLTRQIYLASEPLSVAIADVNGDGFPDIISSGGDIVFGNGKGQFSSPKYYPIASNGDANSVVASDLRNNGLTDLVFANFEPGFSVLLSLGKGRYQDGESLRVSGGPPDCGISADFNGDGIPDLAIGLEIGNGISILLGTGKALSPYTQGEVIPVSAYTCPVTGDLNGDGIPDLFVTTTAGTAVVYLGIGDGTFTQVAQTTSLSANGVPVLSDFNGDGKLDFALTSNLMAYGNGDGTFQRPKPYIPQVISSNITGIAAARLNEDANSDIVLSDFISNTVYVLLSNGKGGFTQTTFDSNTDGACYHPFAVLLADVNADSQKDLLLACSGPTVPIYVNNGAGIFQYATSVGFPGYNNTVVPLVADFNGDGIVDIVVDGDFSLAIFAGEGSLTFAAPTFIGHGTATSAALALDTHRQRKLAGRPDLVVPDATGVVYVYLNTTK